MRVKNRTKLQNEMFGGTECDGDADVTEPCNAAVTCLSKPCVDSSFLSILIYYFIGIYRRPIRSL